MTTGPIMAIVIGAFYLCFWFSIICTFWWVRYEDKKRYPEKYLKWLK